MARFVDFKWKTFVQRSLLMEGFGQFSGLRRLGDEGVCSLVEVGGYNECV